MVGTQGLAAAQARTLAAASAGAPTAGPIGGAAAAVGLAPEVLKGVYYAAVFLTRHSQLQLLAAFPPRAAHSTTFAEHMTVLFQPGAAELTPAVCACVGREVELEVYAVARGLRCMAALVRWPGADVSDVLSGDAFAALDAHAEAAARGDGSGVDVRISIR